MNMVKCVLSMVIILSNGCIYDPPQGSLTIYNYTDSAIYIAYGCSDSLSYKPKLELFEVFKGAVNSNPEIPNNPIISPSYRINAYTSNSIQAFGQENNKNLPCENKRLNLFIISESIMRTKSWEEIYKFQIYTKKISVTKKKLDSSNWTILYKEFE